MIFTHTYYKHALTYPVTYEFIFYIMIRCKCTCAFSIVNIFCTKCYLLDAKLSNDGKEKSILSGMIFIGGGHSLLGRLYNVQFKSQWQSFSFALFLFPLFSLFLFQIIYIASSQVCVWSSIHLLGEPNQKSTY